MAKEKWSFYFQTYIFFLSITCHFLISLLLLFIAILQNPSKMVPLQILQVSFLLLSFGGLLDTRLHTSESLPWPRYTFSFKEFPLGCFNHHLFTTISPFLFFRFFFHFISFYFILFCLLCTIHCLLCRLIQNLQLQYFWTCNTSESH